MQPRRYHRCKVLVDMTNLASFVFIEAWRDNEIHGYFGMARRFDLPSLESEVSGFIHVGFKSCPTESCGENLIPFGAQECQGKPEVKIHGAHMDIFTSRHRLIRDQE